MGTNTADKQSTSYEFRPIEGYVKSLGWPSVASPVTPYIKFMFRGTKEWHEFPATTNKIYIENATFDVVDSRAWSSASITLADPDFVNLEKLFLKAIWVSTSGRNNELWFLKANWGWTHYGKPVGNKSTDGYVEQRKSSGIHYYFLKDLKYDVDDIELRVTIDLEDLGPKILDMGEHGPKVGFIKEVREELAIELRAIEREENRQIRAAQNAQHYMEARGAAEVKARQDRRAKAIEEATGKDIGTIKYGESWHDYDSQVVGNYGPEYAQNPMDMSDPGNTTGKRTQSQHDSSQPKEEDEGEKPIENNVFLKKGGYTHWEVITTILSAHGIRYFTLPGEESEPETEVGFEEKPIIVPSDRNLYDAVKDLIKNVPAKELKGSSGDPIMAQWSIMPGTIVEKSGFGAIIFGYKPVQPAASQRQAVFDNYFLARKWVYRPSTLYPLVSGQSMVKSFNFSWDAQGPWGPVAPRVFAAVKLETTPPKWKIFYTESAFKEAGGTVTENESTGETEIRYFEKKPKVVDVDLDEAVRQMDGVELKFNFNTNLPTSETIVQKANTLIINMWNYFINFIIEVDIEIFGDPFLDNSPYNKEATISDARHGYLVNMFRAYFMIDVFTGTGVRSALLSGNYLCLHGCSHRISEGDYTTALKLIKVPPDAASLAKLAKEQQEIIDAATAAEETGV